jgi:hypothetical protein
MICENKACGKDTVVVYITDEGKLCPECSDRLKKKKARKIILRKAKVKRK